MPDGKPFFGGTYFPPEDQGGRPGFRRILLAVADAYQNKREDLLKTSEALAEAVAKAEAFAGAKGEFDLGVIDSQISSLTQLFDLRNGGFGQAPKFPHASAVDLLFERFRQTAEKHLLAMAETTLEKMAKGGVYDQLAGGFHRYSVDERWLVPHFEKMSYDNSELLRNYLHGWQVTRNPFLNRNRRKHHWLGEPWISPINRMVVFTPARTPTTPSTTMATILHGHSQNCGRHSRPTKRL